MMEKSLSMCCLGSFRYLSRATNSLICGKGKIRGTMNRILRSSAVILVLIGVPGAASADGKVTVVISYGPDMTDPIARTFETADGLISVDASRSDHLSVRDTGTTAGLTIDALNALLLV